MFGQMTQEERIELLEKARIAREVKKKEDYEYATANLKLEYADEPEWRRLASKVGFRLPSKYEAYNAKRTRKLLKKVGRDVSWCTDYWGCTIDRIGDINPTWTSRAICGLILEEHFYQTPDVD